MQNTSQSKKKPTKAQKRKKAQEKSLKTCKQCKNKKHATTEFYWQPHRQRFGDVCRTCTHKNERQTLDQELADRKAQRKRLNIERKNQRDISARTHRDAQKARAREKELLLDKKEKEAEKLTAVEQELAERVLCERHMIPFIQRFNRRYDAGWVHKDICRRLEKFIDDVLAFKSPRLMLFMPPRHGKSEIASVNFPAWAFGKDPTLEIIISSYSAPLATSFSRKVRSLIRSDEYGAIFPRTRLDPDQQGAEHWSTTKGGNFVAAGVGGPITGKGARVFIIDDPLKNREEADSQLTRDSVWDWYTSTAYTRLEPGGGLLVIQTRWHDDDLSGRLINMMDSDEPDVDQFEIVMYPALAETEEYINPETQEIVTDFNPEEKDQYKLLRSREDSLHPARYDHKALKRIRSVIGPRDWSALYQQNPIPDEGEYFKKQWIQTGNFDGRIGRRFFSAWDLAIGQKQTNDFTVGVTWSVDTEGYCYFENLIRGRMSIFEIADAILDEYERIIENKWDFSLIGIERGQLHLALNDVMYRRMKERKLRPSFCEELKPVTDKTVRARPLQGLMQSGQLFWPKENIWWVSVAQKELLRFPSGQFDDIVDAAAWAARMLTYVGLPRQYIKKHKQKSWKDQLKLDNLRRNATDMAS